MVARRRNCCGARLLTGYVTSPFTGTLSTTRLSLGELSRVGYCITLNGRPLNGHPPSIIYFAYNLQDRKHQGSKHFTSIMCVASEAVWECKCKHYITAHSSRHQAPGIYSKVFLCNDIHIICCCLVFGFVVSRSWWTDCKQQILFLFRIHQLNISE